MSTKKIVDASLNYDFFRSRLLKEVNLLISRVIRQKIQLSLAGFSEMFEP